VGRGARHGRRGIRAGARGDASTSFGIFSCSKATNEMNFLAQKLARQVMATNNIDSCNRT
jgi:formate dehydrogenase major subunit